MQALIMDRVDVVDAVQCCGRLLLFAQFFFQRCQFFERARVIAADLFIFSEYEFRGLLVALRQVYGCNKLVGIGGSDVLGIFVRGAAAHLASGQS
jgi:hypothetical protein